MVSYTGPGDLKPYLVWAGLRGYSAAYCVGGANPCFDLWVSGVFVGTINILSSGACDVATALTLIGSGVGKIGKLYDQSGGGNHYIQTNDTHRPVFTMNAPGIGSGQPSMAFVSNVNLVTINNIPAQPQPFTLTGFAQRTGALTIISDVIQTPVNIYLGFGTSADVEFASPIANDVAAADNAWHSMVGVAAGASGIMGVDGVSATGLSVGTNTPSGVNFLNISGFQQFVGFITEAGYAAGGFSTGDITALNTNDQYWFGAIPGIVGSPGKAHPIIYYNDWY